MEEAAGPRALIQLGSRRRGRSLWLAPLLSTPESPNTPVNRTRRQGRLLAAAQPPYGLHTLFIYISVARRATRFQYILPGPRTATYLRIWRTRVQIMHVASSLCSTRVSSYCPEYFKARGSGPREPACMEIYGDTLLQQRGTVFLDINEYGAQRAVNLYAGREILWWMMN